MTDEKNSRVLRQKLRPVGFLCQPPTCGLVGTVLPTSSERKLNRSTVFNHANI